MLERFWNAETVSSSRSDDEAAAADAAAWAVAGAGRSAAATTAAESVICTYRCADRRGEVPTDAREKLDDRKLCSGCNRRIDLAQVLVKSITKSHFRETVLNHLTAGAIRLLPTHVGQVGPDVDRWPQQQLQAADSWSAS